MNIMELGAMGELVGGVAVIASLLYVGLQVRQSVRSTQSQITITGTFDEKARNSPPSSVRGTPAVPA